MRRHDYTSDTPKTTDAPGDVFASLLENRILFLTNEINAESANTLCAQIIILSLQAPDEDIYLFVNSEGGNVTDTMAIYDVMQSVSCDVATVCIGEAASGASLILSAGAKGKRFSLPHARIMMHQPQGGVEGSSKDVAIEAQELLRLRGMLTDLLAKHTGMHREKVHQILERDTYLTAQNACDMGVIDRVIDRLPV